MGASHSSIQSLVAAAAAAGKQIDNRPHGKKGSIEMNADI